MAIRDEVLKERVEGYKNPEDLLGPEGLLKQLTAALIRRAPHRYHPPETVRPPLRRLAGALVGGYCTKGHLTTSSRGSMQPIDKRNLVAQWAFDTRPVLLRFHLWLEDVELERAQPEPVSVHAFTPRGIARCLAMTSAATALGTRLFGGFGEGAGKDKATLNQVKKSADAISAYVMSEGLWHLTRTLPENHAIMVSLGEGLMPKAGETPEMGANPLLG